MKYTFEDVKKSVEEVGYELLSKREEIENEKGYIKTSTKIKIWCKNPNHQPSIKTLNAFNRGGRCRQCKNEKKIIPFKTIKDKINSFGYELLTKEDSYESAKKTKLKIKCSNGHIYETSWDCINQDCRCIKCHLDKQRLSFEYVKEFIEKEGYKLLSNEYHTNQTKLLVKCKNPNHKPYETTFAQFQQGKRCKECRDDSYRFSYEYIKNYIESFGYTLISNNYKNANTKIEVQCDKKHETYSVKFSDFQAGFRCPHCKSSKGENKISEILDTYNINYIKQYKFEDCKFYNYLPFDFYLPDYNCCIEFDGKQHYEIIKCWGGLDAFIDRVIRDTVKNEYCKKNEIKLVRIPYYDFDNIENILIKELNKHE